MENKQFKTEKIGSVTFEYAAELKDVADTWGDGYVRDVYTITLRRGNREIQFEYTQSFVNSERLEVRNSKGKVIKAFNVPMEIRAYNKDRKRATLLPAEVMGMPVEYHPPVPPSAEDVMCGTIVDANSYPMSFEDFCAEYGYSEDSRKAYKTYQACRDLALNVQTLFSYDEVEAMRETLEEDGLL